MIKTFVNLRTERGSLSRLANLIKSITPVGDTTTSGTGQTTTKPVEWDEDEPESISCLREVSSPLASAYTSPNALNSLKTGSFHSSILPSPLRQRHPNFDNRHSPSHPLHPSFPHPSSRRSPIFSMSSCPSSQ